MQHVRISTSRESEGGIGNKTEAGGAWKSGNSSAAAEGCGLSNYVSQGPQSLRRSRRQRYYMDAEECRTVRRAGNGGARGRDDPISPEDPGRET